MVPSGISYDHHQTRYRTLQAVIDRRAQRHHVAFVQDEACHVVTVHQHDHARAVRSLAWHPTRRASWSVQCDIVQLITLRSNDRFNTTLYGYNAMSVGRVSGVMKFAQPLLVCHFLVRAASRRGKPPGFHMRRAI
jgi:hypothetical protein